MFFLFLLPLASAVVSVVAFVAPPILSPRVAHESRRSVPPGWSLRRRADPGAHLPLKFALAQSNLHNLDAYLLDIADPQSANYGKHWSPAKIATTFRPSEESVDTVRSWLVNEGGIDSHSIRLAQDGNSLHLNVTIAQAEKILATEYYIYHRGEDDSQRVGCHHGYSLPEHVAKHVDLVWPTVHFGGPSFSPRERREKRDGKAGARRSATRRPSGPPKTLAEITDMAPGAVDCDKSVTLDCLRGLYNFDYELVATDKNSIGVLEFGPNVFLPSDLNMFFKQFDPAQVGHQPTLVSVAGGHLNATEVAASGNLGEATMDFELVMGLLGRKQEVLLYQVGTDASDQTTTDQWLAALDASYCSVEGVKELGLSDCGTKPPAYVVSISYSTEVDVNDPGISAMNQRECLEFGKLSLAGMTFVVSSGDDGVSFGPTQVCVPLDGDLSKPLEGNKPGIFLPQFPASCPYVTTVGATSVAPGKSVDDPEVATTAFPSGGGFSNIFPRPRFQNRAVSKYLTKFVPSYGPTIFNRTGRAYPDVSANGFPTVVAVGGNFTKSGGTSASAPIFASLIAAVNDARIGAGKGPVGWINPAIYSHLFHGAFNDVTNGTNPGCGTEGFVAAPGWDPVTGLGTPNFQKLLARFMSLP